MIKEKFPILYISMISVGLLVFFNYVILLPVALIIIFVLKQHNKKKTLLWIVIVTLLTMVGEINQSLRIVIQILDLLVLLYLFISKFGLDFTIYPRIPNLFLSFLIFYYVTIILSVAMSDYLFTGVNLLIRQSVFFLIVYLLYSLIDDESDIKNYFYALIFSAIVMAISTAYTFYFDSIGIFDLQTGNRGRVSGLLSNSNSIANYYMVAFPLLIISILRSKSLFISVTSWIIILIFSFALVLSLSRSALVGIIISAIMVFYILKRKYLYYFIILPGTILIFILLNDSINSYVSLFLRIERGITGRDYLWGLSINIIKDNPVFGLGPGGYKYEMFNYLPVMMDSWTGGLFKKIYEMTDGANLSHNYFLFLFSEMGVFGFIVSIFLLVVFLNYFRLIKIINDKTSKTYYIVVALLSIGVSEFFRGSVESIGILYYGAITSDLPFWLVFISLMYYSNSKYLKSKNDFKKNSI